MNYRVTWTIDVDAEDEVDAAREALAAMKDPESFAPVFEIARVWTIDCEALLAQDEA